MTIETGMPVACWSEPASGTRVTLRVMTVGFSGATTILMYEAPARSGSLGTVAPRQALAEMQRRIDAGAFGPGLVRTDLARC